MMNGLNNFTDGLGSTFSPPDSTDGSAEQSSIVRYREKSLLALLPKLLKPQRQSLRPKMVDFQVGGGAKTEIEEAAKVGRSESAIPLAVELGIGRFNR